MLPFARRAFSELVLVKSLIQSAASALFELVTGTARSEPPRKPGIVWPLTWPGITNWPGRGGVLLADAAGVPARADHRRRQPLCVDVVGVRLRGVVRLRRPRGREVEVLVRRRARRSTSASRGRPSTGRSPGSRSRRRSRRRTPSRRTSPHRRCRPERSPSAGSSRTASAASATYSAVVAGSLVMPACLNRSLR